MVNFSPVAELTANDCTVDINIEELLNGENQGDCVDSVKGFFIGQENAIKALETGVNIKSLGYNIFVCGMPGTGRMTAVQKMIDNIIDAYDIPNDLCYIYNFDNPDEPKLLELPRGLGIKLKERMEAFLKNLFVNIPKIIESESFISAKNKVLHKYSDEGKQNIKQLGEKLEKEGFTLVEVSYRDTTIPDIYVRVEDKVIPWDEYIANIEKGEIEKGEINIQEMEQNLEIHRAELENIFNQNRKLSKEMGKEIDNLVRDKIKFDIENELNQIGKDFQYPIIQKYIKDVMESVLQNFNRFFNKDGEQVTDLSKVLDYTRSRNFFNRFTINVIVDNSNLTKAPVIVETQPNFVNIFGTIERTADKFGVWTTDFSRIKAGSLLKSHGGFLVMNAYDVLQEYNVWKQLTRVLKMNILEIQHPESQFGFSPNALKPEPVKINTKVILIGDEYLFDMLYNWDEYFRKIFKIKSSFEIELSLTDENLKKYIALIKKMHEEEKFLPISNNAIKYLLTFSIRQAGYHNKLSAKVGVILDLMREADFWARKKQ